jgi:hypothetical protein
VSVVKIKEIISPESKTKLEGYIKELRIKKDKNLFYCPNGVCCTLLTDRNLNKKVK